ncbi:MAG: hypothetical protein D6762_09625, partial [Candidatus Neomarinimicrobiota bacterium]
LMWIQNQKAELDQLPEGSQLIFLADDELQPGECIVESDTEIYQGLISEYLAYFRETLQNGGAR